MATQKGKGRRVGRILIVDDDKAIRELYARMLRKAGYETEEAANGDAALEVLRAHRFDVMVLDLNMPGADGFEVMRMVKSEHPHIRILVTSGYLQGALLLPAECLGAAITIEKTKAPQLLVRSVRKLLGDRD